MSLDQFKLVHNVFSLMIAVMGIAAVLFILQRAEIQPRLRAVVTALGLMALAASYGYVRLFEGWNHAFTVVNGVVASAGHPFDDTYRFAQGLVTAPLLLIAYLLALDAPAQEARPHLLLPAMSAAAMIVVAGAGALVATPETRLFWTLAALAPFAIVLYHLYVSVAKDVHHQPGSVRPLLTGARFAILASWAAYHCVAAFPLFGLAGTAAFVAAQVAYAGADLVALIGVALPVFTVAMRRSAMEATEPAAGQKRPAHRTSQRPRHAIEADAGQYG